jgi:FkbM family methyltransferase
MVTMRVNPNAESQAEWQKKDREHLRYEYDLSRTDLVIDIGAYRGEWAEEIYSRYGCKLILIEPGPWIAGCEYGQVINMAASGHDGTEKFGGAYYYTSAHEEPTHEYRCFDINTLLERYDEIALCKINIEGAEYGLLDHIIKARLHERIRNLQIQFHEIDGEPYQTWYNDIESDLVQSHKLTFRFPFCWENWCLNS